MYVGVSFEFYTNNLLTIKVELLATWLFDKKIQLKFNKH
jgi:hypothetical protein